MDSLAFAPSTFFGLRYRGLSSTVLISKSKGDVKSSPVVMVTKAPGRSAVFDKFMASTAPWANASLAKIGSKAETVVARSALQVKTLCDADDYIAKCMKKQYVERTQKGVYSLQCSEGAATYAAEESRVAALAAEFRRRQVPTVTSFADLYESRKLAFASVGDCGYEASMVKRFAKSAETLVLGQAEMLGACVRYAEPASVEEKYMMECVLRAATARATQGGCYSAMCSDGTTSGAAESKRVRALSVKFRNKQVGPLVSTQRKFNQSKVAFSLYSKGCEYEDRLFAKYPATAAAMRPAGARY